MIVYHNITDQALPALKTCFSGPPATTLHPLAAATLRHVAWSGARDGCCVVSVGTWVTWHMCTVQCSTAQYSVYSVYCAVCS